MLSCMNSKLLNYGNLLINTSATYIMLASIVICVFIVMGVGVKECKCRDSDWKGVGRERAGMFTHRWPLGGGIVVVRCHPPPTPPESSWHSRAQFLAKTLPHHFFFYLFSSSA